MKLSIAFGTDDGDHLNNGHFGMAKYYDIYEFDEEIVSLVERRKNVKFKGDESKKHGDPQKAKATSSVLAGVDVLAGRKFGPNLPRILKKFVCVLVRRNSIAETIELINKNIDRIVEEKRKSNDRKHIVLR